MSSDLISELQEKIIEIFLYQKDTPFVFSSLEFWILFGVFLSIFSITANRIKTRNWVLLIFSLYFYYRSSGAAILLLLLVITQDFFIGKKIQATTSTQKKLLLVTWSITGNLLLLSYFKYAHFLADLLNSLFNLDIETKNWLVLLLPENNLLAIDPNHILLPIGISFYIFQSLSYTIDAYRGQVQHLRNWHEYALFVSFFPQLVAGPIVRAKDFIGQMFFPYRLDKQDFGKGLFLILGGLVKKIILSDILSSQLVDRVFDEPTLASSPEAWLAVYGYGLQIFCDFSGYTDIAIGLALLLGFRLNPNFDQPYQSLSITEFWRRWHISLSIWLKDYLYIPLGGNRKGNIRTYVNLLITMLLGGLWHGANLKFLIWGGLHGAALALHKFWTRMLQNSKFFIPNPLAWLITFHFVLFCWIPFRARDFADIGILMRQMVRPASWELFQSIATQFSLPIGLILVGFAIHFLPGKLKGSIESRFSGMPIWLQAMATVCLLVVIYQFKLTENKPFIYFQF